MTSEVKLNGESRSFLQGKTDEIVRASFTLIVILFSVASFWLTFGSANDVLSCCDTWQYIAGGKTLFNSGLLEKTPGYGYRSYLSFGITHIIALIGKPILALAEFKVIIPAFIDPNSGPNAVQYVAGAGFVHLLIATALIWSQRLTPIFFISFAAIYLNPLLLIYIPYPLQEGQFFLLAAPLLILILNSKNRGARFFALVGTFAGIVTMLKSSFILMILPIALFAYVNLRKSDDVKRSLAAMLIPFAILILPQSTRALAHYSTPFPYPDQRVLPMQLSWGVEVWKFDTWLAPDGFRGRKYKTPFAPRLKEDGFYKSNPAAAALLWIGHTLSAFDYSHLRPYPVVEKAPLVSIFNLASFAILFIGVATSIQIYVKRLATDNDILIDGLALATLAVIPLIAPETRFGSVTLAMMTIRSLKATQMSWSRSELALLSFGLLAFMLTALLAVFQINAAAGVSP
jgi:hypothetical protein